MLDAMVQSLEQLVRPETFLFLLLGVFVGMLTGLMPGLGGAVGMALLLPFVYGAEPASAIAMLVGIMAVNNTSDTFTAILLGVPGSNSSQATIMDGYPMARRGEAARALGAALFGSMVGGVIGALALVALIPVARPLILSLESPALLMLMLIGVATVGVLSGSKPAAGLTAGFLGLLLGSVGPAPAGPSRFIIFDWVYLRQGISVIIVVMGLYAIPELISLLKERTPVTRGNALRKGGLVQGVRDVWKHKFIVLFSSIYAICAGMIPGLSGGAVAWTTYAGVKTLSRNSQNFGRGDVRGVIGPDSGNNAMEGGQLVPIMMFGIPGSASGAILLGGLFLVGVEPGPDMIEGDGLVLLLVTAFSVALANIIATAICMGGAPYIARLTNVSPGKLVPPIFLIVLFATWQVSNHWDDVYLLLGIATIGLILHRRGWPRAPMLIGFVLGAKVEGKLRISLDRYGTEWMTWTIVLVLGAILFLIIGAGILMTIREVRSAKAETAQTEREAAIPHAEVVRGSELREAGTLYWLGWFVALILSVAVFGMTVGGPLWLAAFLWIESKVRWKGILAYLAGFALISWTIISVVGAEMPTPWWN